MSRLLNNVLIAEVSAFNFEKRKMFWKEPVKNFKVYQLALAFFILFFQFTNQQSRFIKAGDTEGRREVHGPLPNFLYSKRKKGNKGKKERVSKQKLLKGCHQGRNVAALTILERLPTMVADNTFPCSMAPPL